MKKSPSAEIIHISTPHDIQDIYGKEAFKAYVIEELGNGLAIRSKSVFLDGTPSNCTPYELGEVWDIIIGRIIANKKINLGQMLRNYASIESKPEHKKAIFNVLFDIAMTSVDNNTEMTEEVATIGIGMMLKDNLDNSNPMSIVHIVNDRAISVLSSVPEKEAKTA